MMTLADWEAAINAEPANALIRLVFADWLQDSGDPELVALADGIRAFAECGRVPHNFVFTSGLSVWWWWNNQFSGSSSAERAAIIGDVFLKDTPENTASAFAAFMFAAREWPYLDQKEFYRAFGPKVEVTA